MALIKINGEYKMFSNDKKMLTLTDEDYELYPDAKEYTVCITETRTIVNFRGIISFHERLEGFIYVTKNVFLLHMNTKKMNMMISVVDNQHILEKMYTYLAEHDAKNEFWADTNEFWNNDHTAHKIVYNPVTGEYFQVFTETTFVSEEINDFITHLYHVQSQLHEFIGSAFRNNIGDLIITREKIIRCIKMYDHLLVEYENGAVNLVLLCYSGFYAVPCDIAFPSIMTKSARKYLEQA
jgi:hypothetical protein